MAHTLQDRYSKLVLAKLRKELNLKDGIVFNTSYEGDPKAGAVKVPVRDTEVTASDYDKADGLTPGEGTTTYETITIDCDKAVNEVIDGYDAEAVPDGIVAERLDSAGYSLALAEDNDGMAELIANGTAVTLTSAASTSNIYKTFVAQRTAMSKANVPNDGKRFALCTPDTVALLLECDQFVRATSLGDATVENGVIGKIAGFNVIEVNDATAKLVAVCGHPMFATRVREFAVPVHIQDLNGSGNYIGASAVQGREVFAHKVLRATAIRVVKNPA